MLNKKNSIQVGVIEHNQKKGGWWCAQKLQPIFHTEKYRFKFVKFLPIFGL